MKNARGLVGALVLAGLALVPNVFGEGDPRSYKILKDYAIPTRARIYTEQGYAKSQDMRNQVAKMPGKTLEEKKRVFVEQIAGLDNELITEAIFNDKYSREDLQKIAVERILPEFKKIDGNCDYDDPQVIGRFVDLMQVKGEIFRSLMTNVTEKTGSPGFKELEKKAFPDKSREKDMNKRIREANERYYRALKNSLNPIERAFSGPSFGFFEAFDYDHITNGFTNPVEESK